MNDADIIKWLDHWLTSFSWRSDERLCYLVFHDPYGHDYEASGKDLRDCVANAVAKQPTSCTFIGIPRE